MPRRVKLDEDPLDALRRVPLFDRCPEDELAAIARDAVVIAYDDGEVIVPEGDEGSAFYVILQGRTRVTRAGADVAVLGPGESFGEVALLQDRPRTATVLAVGETTVLGILRAAFKPMLLRNPRVALRILEQERERSDA
jgi:CRP/FNR family transcriptional regulator